MSASSAARVPLLDRTGEALTVDDWYSLPESADRYELHEGMLVMAPPPDGHHQDLSAVLHFALLRFAMDHGGWAVASPMGVALSSIHGYEPDVLYLRPVSMAKRRKRGIEGAPDLVVEILSPGTRRYDLRQKLPAYLELGVEEVWIVDPKAKTISVHRKDEVTATVRFGQQIPSRIVEIGNGLIDRVPPEAD